jgi:hypothetical protein
VYSYARQQQILTSLGFYTGKIDGFWGPKTIDAKKRFEREQSFKPCIPNYGHPFMMASPLPSCIYPSSDGLLHLHGVQDSDLPAVDTLIETYLSPKDKKEQVKFQGSDRPEDEAYPSDITNRKYTEVDLSKKVANILAAESM